MRLNQKDRAAIVEACRLAIEGQQYRKLSLGRSTATYGSMIVAEQTADADATIVWLRDLLDRVKA